MLFFLAIARFNSSLSGDASIFFIWIASAGLILIVALIMAGLYPDTYGLYLPLAAVLKGLQVVFGVALVFSLLMGSSLGVSSGASAPLAPSLPFILPVVGMDILALLLLLTISVRRRRTHPSSEKTSAPASAALSAPAGQAEEGASGSAATGKKKLSGKTPAAAKNRGFFKKKESEESSLPEARVTDVDEEE